MPPGMRYAGCTEIKGSTRRHHRATAAQWLQMVEQSRRSGLTRAGLFRRRGIPLATLNWWLTKTKRASNLWFDAVPRGDVGWEFGRSRGLEPVRRRLTDFTGTIQTDAYEVYQSLERKESRQASHAQRLAVPCWWVPQVSRRA